MIHEALRRIVEAIPLSTNTPSDALKMIVRYDPPRRRAAADILWFRLEEFHLIAELVPEYRSLALDYIEGSEPTNQEILDALDWSDSPERTARFLDALFAPERPEKPTTDHLLQLVDLGGTCARRALEAIGSRYLDHDDEERVREAREKLAEEKRREADRLFDELSQDPDTDRPTM